MNAPPESLQINASLSIPLREVEWRFSSSGGPGGQHADTANTKVEARFDIANSPSLSEGQRNRLMRKIGPEAIVVVSDERSQGRNRAIALERLGDMLAKALVKPKRRIPTRPGKGATRRRLEAKQRRGQIKKLRRRIDRWD